MKTAEKSTIYKKRKEIRTSAKQIKKILYKDWKEETHHPGSPFL